MPNDFPTVADLVADSPDLSGTEISNFRDAAPLVSRLPMLPSSNGTIHQWITYAAKPEVAWRTPNNGRGFKHSYDAHTSVSLAILDWSHAADKAVADAWQKGAVHYVNREGGRHVKSALQHFENQLLNNAFASPAFVGLPGCVWLDDLSDSMVVNAGGTVDGEVTNVWLLRIGTDGVCGVDVGIGKPFTAGETIVQNYTDESGERPIYYRPACTWVGLQTGGSYSVSRIANITTESGATVNDDLLYQAYSRHPVDQRPNVVCMSERSLAQLQKSRTATNKTGAPAPFPTEWEGLPILVTPQLSDAEDVLA